MPYATEVTGPEFNPPAGAWAISPGLVRPKSRGRVYLEPNDPKAQAKVDAQFLSHEDDLTAVLASIEKCREIGNSAPLSDFVKREVMPGALSADEIRSHYASRRQQLDAWEAEQQRRRWERFQDSGIEDIVFAVHDQ